MRASMRPSGPRSSSSPPPTAASARTTGSACAATAHWNVPEPELALVLNPEMQIVGFTVGNDVSSRDIEGENPLYLPQAKVYRHSCALGPAITAGREGVDAAQPGHAPCRSSATARSSLRAQTNTSQIHRSLDELADYLGRYYDFPLRRRPAHRDLHRARRRFHPRATATRWTDRDRGHRRPRQSASGRYRSGARPATGISCRPHPRY